MNTIRFETSSNIQSATLDERSGVLDVTFANGKTYRFANFTLDLLKQFEAAPSPGKWFADTVKKRPDAHPQVKDAASAASVVTAATAEPAAPAQTEDPAEPYIAMVTPSESITLTQAPIAREKVPFAPHRGGAHADRPWRRGKG